MIILDCQQNTKEWFEARAEIPTASKANMIITPGGEPSKQMNKYVDEKLAEYLAGNSFEEETDNYWMKRGNETEGEAIECASFLTGKQIDRVGFCKFDDNSAGASPDGLIETDGMVEVKCPKHTTMIEYYRNGFPDIYFNQIQFQLWVTERKYCIFFAYHPSLKPFIHRVERDEIRINGIFSAVANFNIKLREAKKDLERWKVN